MTFQEFPQQKKIKQPSFNDSQGSAFGQRTSPQFVFALADSSRVLAHCWRRFMPSTISECRPRISLELLTKFNWRGADAMGEGFLSARSIAISVFE
jgi:hypothetical protein